MTLELKRVSIGTEALRDVFAVHARLLDDREYVQFVSSAMTGLSRDTEFSNIAESHLAAALLHFAAEEVGRAVADGRIPLKDPTQAYEVRVEPETVGRFWDYVRQAQADLLPDDSAIVEVAPQRLGELDPKTLRIERLELRNLYGFGPHSGRAETHIEFDSAATVLIGANGAGKSNIFFALDFIRDNMLGQSARRSAVPRFVEAPPESWTSARLILRDEAGLSASCETSFDADGTLVEQRMSVGGRELAFASYKYWRGSVRWLTNEQSGGAFLSKEADANAGSSIWSVVDLDEVHPNIESLFRFLNELRVYRNWRTGGRREHSDDARFARYLQPDLGNLIAVLHRILQDGPLREHFVRQMRGILPGFDGIEIERLDSDIWFGVINERFIPSSSLSDGTRQFLTLCALLLDPDPSGPLLLDEPDLLLHPDAVLRLGRLIVEFCDRRQVIIATHSGLLLDTIAEDNVERVRVVEAEPASGTSARSLAGADLTMWLDEFTVAEAWGRGALGGNP